MRYDGNVTWILWQCYLNSCANAKVRFLLGSEKKSVSSQQYHHLPYEKHIIWERQSPSLTGRKPLPSFLGLASAGGDFAVGDLVRDLSFPERQRGFFMIFRRWFVNKGMNTMHKRNSMWCIAVMYHIMIWWYNMKYYVTWHLLYDIVQESLLVCISMFQCGQTWGMHVICPQTTVIQKFRRCKKLFSLNCSGLHLACGHDTTRASYGILQ